MMSKKDFIRLADYLRPVRDSISTEVMSAIESFCREQNPKFNKERWRSYLAGLCGPNGGNLNKNTTIRR